MQFEERSLSKSLPDVLDQALARLRAGESIEGCLDAYPQHAVALEPLLRAGDLLHAEAAAPPPPDLEAWLPTGARDFAAIAAQMAPKYARQPRPARGRANPAQQRAQILDQALARTRNGESIEASLTEHSDHAAELQPLLRAGALLRAQAAMPLPPDLEAWLPTGARDFAAIAEQMAPRYGRRRSAGSRPLTLQRTALAVAIIAAMMGVVDTTSAQSLPGDTLYQWKRTKEDISLALAIDPDQRSHLLVEYAGRRLNEFNTLVHNGKPTDKALMAETLDSLLNNLQGAIVEDQKAQDIDVSPVVKQILDETKSALTQAAVVAPEAAPVLDQASDRAVVIEQEIPPATTAAVTPTETPTETPTPSPTSALPISTIATAPVAATPADGSSKPLPTPTATPEVTLPSTPPPTQAISGPTSPPLEGTSEPTNTPTVDPGTAIPPTAAPTDTSAPSNDTPVPTNTLASPTTVPTNTLAPTDTQIPTATSIPTVVGTDVPTPTTVPTQRPPRTPTETQVPTNTPTATRTPVPTNTPTATNTQVPPTATDTQVPTKPPTQVPPTATNTQVPPTDTPTSVPPTATDTQVPPTGTPVVNGGTQGNGETPTEAPPPPTEAPPPPTEAPPPPTDIATPTT